MRKGEGESCTLGYMWLGGMGAAFMGFLHVYDFGIFTTIVISGREEGKGRE